jgi:hypothetical protein
VVGKKTWPKITFTKKTNPRCELGFSNIFALVTDVGGDAGTPLAAGYPRMPCRRFSWRTFPGWMA